MVRKKYCPNGKDKSAVPSETVDTPLQIIGVTDPVPEDNLIFPNLNYWSICKSLKRDERVRITKDISFQY